MEYLVFAIVMFIWMMSGPEEEEDEETTQGGWLMAVISHKDPSKGGRQNEQLVLFDAGPPVFDLIEGGGDIVDIPPQGEERHDRGQRRLTLCEPDGRTHEEN